mgnify:CR=1 FL=1
MKNRNMIFDFTQCYPKRKESGLEWHDCSAVGGSRLYCSRDAEENCPAFTGKVRNLIHSNFYNPTRAKGTPESIANEFRRISNQIKMKCTTCTAYEITKRRIRTDLYLWREPVLQMQLAAFGALLLDIPFPLQSLQEVIVGIVQRDIYFSIMRNASDTMHQQEVSR